MTTVPIPPQPVVVGVDTHQRTHHAVVVRSDGLRLADREFPVSEDGYAGVLAWAGDYGPVRAFGVESTGSYGAGLTRHLLAAGVDVFEVNRPDRAVRARAGKSDPVDADAAARAVLTGRATARPKVTTGVIEAIRVLSASRGSAIKARTAAMLQLRDLITTAPTDLHDTLIELTPAARIRKAAALRPDPARLAEPGHAIRHALRGLARRIQDLTREITATDTALTDLVRRTVPTLLARPQIGTHTAAQLVITAGQNLHRFRSEASFAKLTGTAPLPASSGKTHRMRLNRGGDRQANRALHLIAIGRLKTHPATLAYAHRRTLDGLSRRDIIRCLKRAITREVYTALKTDLLTT